MLKIYYLLVFFIIAECLCAEEVLNSQIDKLNSSQPNVTVKDKNAYYEIQEAKRIALLYPYIRSGFFINLGIGSTISVHNITMKSNNTYSSKSTSDQVNEIVTDEGNEGVLDWICKPLVGEDVCIVLSKIKEDTSETYRVKSMVNIIPHLELGYEWEQYGFSVSAEAYNVEYDRSISETQTYNNYGFTSLDLVFSGYYKFNFQKIPIIPYVGLGYGLTIINRHLYASKDFTHYTSTGVAVDLNNYEGEDILSKFNISKIQMSPILYINAGFNYTMTENVSLIFNYSINNFFNKQYLLLGKDTNLDGVLYYYVDDLKNTGEFYKNKYSTDINISNPLIQRFTIKIQYYV